MASFVLRGIDPALWRAARMKAGSSRALVEAVESQMRDWIGTIMWGCCECSWRGLLADEAKSHCNIYGHHTGYLSDMLAMRAAKPIYKPRVG